MALSAAGCGGTSGSADTTPTPAATSTPRPTATPAPTANPTPNPDPLTLDGVSEPLAALRERMQQEIDAFQARVSGNFAVAVTDLQTGETVGVNGNDAERIPGCTMNFFVLLMVARDLQAGRYPEQEVGRYIAQTVWASDPGTGHYLLRKSADNNSYAGLWKVNDLIHNVLHLDSAVYDHPPANDQFTLKPGEWHENRISPLDFNRALTMLYRGDVLDETWTEYLLEKMSHVKPGLNHLIPVGVGDPTAVIAHKNGYIDYVPYYVDNDVGIVMFERSGKRYAYAFTFWSQDNPWVLSDAPLGQTLSRLAWEHFSSVYQ